MLKSAFWPFESVYSCKLHHNRISMISTKKKSSALSNLYHKFRLSLLSGWLIFFGIRYWSLLLLALSILFREILEFQKCAIKSEQLVGYALSRYFFSAPLHISLQDKICSFFLRLGIRVRLGFRVRIIENFCIILIIRMEANCQFKFIKKTSFFKTLFGLKAFFPITFWITMGS